MVLRTQTAGGKGMAAQHSKSLEAWLLHTPGLHVIMPSTPYDAKGLLKAAIRSDNPVVFIEQSSHYPHAGFLPNHDYVIPIGKADIKRVGRDVTLVAYGRMVQRTLEAAEGLQRQHNIEAEVIDLRTLKPLDVGLIAQSVRKTNRIVTVSESFPICGVGREIVGALMEYTLPDGVPVFDYLDAPPVNLAAADVPPPMSEPLETAAVPSSEKIVQAVRSLV